MYIGQALLDQLYTDALRRSTPGLSVQLLFFVREVKTIATQISTALTGSGSIQAVRLVQMQNALRQVKTNIQNWPHGSLTDSAVRQQLVASDPVHYPDVASVGSQIQAANQAFNQLTVELESVLASARAAGQLYNADPVTGEEVFLLVSSPETDSLLTFADSLIALLTE